MPMNTLTVWDEPCHICGSDAVYKIISPSGDMFLCNQHANEYMSHSVTQTAERADRLKNPQLMPYKRIVDGVEEHSADGVTWSPWRLTLARLKEISDRTNAATVGPWRFFSGQQTFDGVYAVDPNDLDVVLGWLAETSWDADAEFIAHARSDIPALLAEINALHLELNSLYNEVD